MHIDWSTLALQTVNALVLVWLLARFLFRPVADIVAARQKAAQALLADAEASRRAAQAGQDAAREENARLAASREAALRAAEADAEAHKARLLALARAEAAQVRVQAENEMDRERTAQARAIEGDAVRLAVEIAGRLLDRMPPEARVQGFIGGTADALASLPPETRAGFGAQGEPLVGYAYHRGGIQQNPAHGGVHLQDGRQELSVTAADVGQHLDPGKVVRQEHGLRDQCRYVGHRFVKCIAGFAVSVQVVEQGRPKHVWKSRRVGLHAVEELAPGIVVNLAERHHQGAQRAGSIGL